LAVNEDGSVMSLRVDPIENARPSGSVILHTASLTRAGFKIAGLAADGLISIPAGQPFELSAKR